MRRAFSGLILLVVLFAITVLCTGLYYLQCTHGGLAEAQTEQITKGNIHSLLLSRDFWSAYPSFPSLEDLVYAPAILSSGVLLAIFVYLLGIRKKGHLLSASLGCLLAGMLHYAVGMWALSGNTEFAYSGRWVAVMLIGMLYCWGSCAVFAGADVFKITMAKTFK